MTDAITTEVSESAGAVETAPETETPAAEAAAPPVAEAVAPKPPVEDKAASLKARQVADFIKQERAFRAKEAEARNSWEAREREHAQRTAELNEQFERLQSFMGEIDKDPITWLQKHKGIGPEEYYNRALNNGQPTKEEQLQRRLEMLQNELEGVKGWKTQQEEAAQKRQEEQEQLRQAAAEKKLQEQAEAELAHAQNEFWGKIETNPRTYPYLSAYPKGVILEAAAKYVQDLGEEANTKSYDDVASVLEQGAREMHEALNTKVKPLLAPETPPATSSQGAPGTPESAGAAALESAAAPKHAKNRRAVGKAAASVTLNSNMTAARQNAKTQRSREDEIEALKRELESASNT